MVLDGYIRVSQVAGRGGEQFISPSVQREEIEAWTSSNGAVIGEIFEELDESGGRADRPLLEQAIGRVEGSESAGIIVAKLDRFGRSLLDGLSAIARIEEAGGTFISVQDGFDLGTSTGKLVLRILFSIGEWELERTRRNWDIARGRAVARGLFVFGSPPPGYRRGKDRRLRIERKEAPVMREVFERRLRGESFDKIADFLNDSELKTKSGVPFGGFQVGLLIKTRAYRGEVHSGRHHNPNGHEAIVDSNTWEACQSSPRVAGEWVQALLGGRIRCATCGRMMGAARESRHNRLTYYHCPGVKGQCHAPAHVRVDLIDPLVEEFMFRLCRRSRPTAVETAVLDCKTAVAGAEEKLAVYRDNPRLMRKLGPEAFEAGVGARQRLVDRKLLELARAKKALRVPRLDLEDLEGRWAELSWKDRCSAVGELIDCIVVGRGSAAVIDRAWVFRRGRGPRAYDEHGKTVEQFDPALENASRLAPVRRWPPKRIEKELRAFLGARLEWPSHAEFADAGYGRLETQVMAWGGPFYWGHKLGVRVQMHPVWNDQLLGDALAPLLEGRKVWPEAAEFQAAGMAPVWRAIRYRGGMERWAKDLGFEYRKKKINWTDEEIERELLDFVGGREELPTWSEFEEAGRLKLYLAIGRHGGLADWSRRIGVQRASRSTAAKRRARSFAAEETAQTRARSRTEAKGLGRVDEDQVRPASLEPLDRGLPTVGGAVVNDPEHAAGGGVGLFGHHLPNEPVKRFDPALGLRAPEHAAAAHVPGSQVGERPATLIGVLDSLATSEARGWRERLVNPPPRLD